LTLVLGPGGQLEGVTALRHLGAQLAEYRALIPRLRLAKLQAALLHGDAPPPAADAQAASAHGPGGPGGGGAAPGAVLGRAGLAAYKRALQSVLAAEAVASEGSGVAAEEEEEGEGAAAAAEEWRGELREMVPELVAELGQHMIEALRRDCRAAAAAALAVVERAGGRVEAVAANGPTPVGADAETPWMLVQSAVTPAAAAAAVDGAGTAEGGGGAAAATAARWLSSRQIAEAAASIEAQAAAEAQRSQARAARAAAAAEISAAANQEGGGSTLPPARTTPTRSQPAAEPAPPGGGGRAKPPRSIGERCRGLSGEAFLCVVRHCTAVLLERLQRLYIAASAVQHAMRGAAAGAGAAAPPPAQSQQPAPAAGAAAASASREQRLARLPGQQQQGGGRGGAAAARSSSSAAAAESCPWQEWLGRVAEKANECVAQLVTHRAQQASRLPQHELGRLIRLCRRFALHSERLAAPRQPPTGERPRSSRRRLTHTCAHRRNEPRDPASQ
jgi:hypothetical protein